MFCDLAASTHLSQQLDPEDLRDVIRAYQETAVAVVQRFGGYVAQYLGDGLLLYFGWPQAHEDDAQRGVRAGLGIIETLTTTLNPRLEREHGVRLAVRIGLHTGPVVVGEMGGGGRHEQLALGETTNVAARLEGLAAPNTMVLSTATATLVKGVFVLDDLGRHALKGVAEPIRVFGVVRERTVAEREAAAEAAGATLLVGRDAELTLLLERWARSKAGQGQMVLVSGEGGIGKSRLVGALRTRVTAEGATRITFRCSPYHQSSALFPVLTHLEQLLQFHRDDTPEGKWAKLERVLGAYRFPRADTLPLLATLFSLPLPAQVPPSRLTPEQQKQHTQHDLIAWLMEEAERQPVLVVWEDVQWIDPSSLEVLSLLLDQIPTVPLLTVVTCRPEFRSPWGMRSHLTPLALGNLGRSHVEAIATHMAGGKTLPAGLITQVAEKTDGVPLFVEELTKAVVESGVLRDAGEQYVLTGPVEAVRIPLTLHDALMARLDRLHTAKSLAQLGAVIGRQFSYDLVKALTAYDEGRLQQELGQLVDAELLYQRGLPPRTTYTFKHALIQDVAYESLLRRRRQALHGAIGEAIEALEGSVRVVEQAGILAYHYARSLHQDKAVTYALLAGDEAMRLHARTEAATSYAQALTLARALPGTPAAQRMQIDAMLKLAAVSRSRDDVARDQANLEQAQALAETLADEPRLTQVRYWQGRVAYVRGDMATAITYAEQSLAIADRLEDETLSTPPVNLLGRSYTMRWDVARGSQLMARSTAQMRQIGNRGEEATAAGFAGYAFGFLGQFAQARVYGDRGVDLARELHDPFAEAAALLYRGMAHDQRGAWTQALADYDAARQVAAGAGDHFRVYLVDLMAGWAVTRAGDPAAARVLLERGLALADQIGTVFLVALGEAFLAACSLALGEWHTVPALCQEALRVAGETSDRFAQAVAYRALAEALTLRTAPDRQQAEQAIGEALRLWKETEFHPELARTYVTSARLFQQWGQEGQARASLTQAIAMFQEMGMDWDRTRAEQLLASWAGTVT
jgi:class 3 adenylate cyclase/tetratricopeptide (TPR) repeat protein